MAMHESSSTPPPPASSIPAPSSTASTVRTRGHSGARLALIFGFVSLTVGGWLFLDARGVEVPPLSRFWPIFLVLGGVASAIDFFWLGRRPRSAGQAVLGFGLAVVGFVLSLGYVDSWREAFNLLPALPTVVGLALLASWAAQRMRNAQLLMIGVVFLALGLSGFVLRFEVLQKILPSAQIIWAVLLLVAGGVMIWRTVARR